MALTKPAGCFLQLVSIPFLLWGLVLLVNEITEHADPVWGVLTLVTGIILLYIGGRPARRREIPQEVRVHVRATVEDDPEEEVTEVNPHHRNHIEPHVSAVLEGLRTQRDAYTNMIDHIERDDANGDLTYAELITCAKRWHLGQTLVETLRKKAAKHAPEGEH